MSEERLRAHRLPEAEQVVARQQQEDALGPARAMRFLRMARQAVLDPQRDGLPVADALVAVFGLDRVRRGRGSGAAQVAALQGSGASISTWMRPASTTMSVSTRIGARARVLAFEQGGEAAGAVEDRDLDRFRHPAAEVARGERAQGAGPPTCTG